MERPDLERLATSDLQALRLGVEVLAHRSELDGRPELAGYFREVEAAVREAIHGDRSASPADAGRLGAVVAPAGADDRRVLAEYLGLLVANERLSTEVRMFCRALRARDSR